MSLLTLNLDTVHLSDEQFYQLCQNNRELQFERTATGELIIMPPVGGDSGNREADFLIELRSARDDLEVLHSKMREYLDAGMQLGWLINPQQQQVEMYRPGHVEVGNLPTELSGENVLPEFSLNLSGY